MHTAQAGDLPVPVEGRFQRIECGQGGINDFGADAVPGISVAGMGVVMVSVGQG